MKGLLILSLLACGVASEAPAPYAPSGWRPNGPSFDLPERAPVDPRNKTPQKQEYLPTRTPNQEYGPPEVDVSVQGLPGQEQLPVFQLSPVNGQQYTGPTFNADLRSLEEQQRDSQLQAQQNIYREFARQRQLEAAYANANRQNQPLPRQFVPSSTTPKPEDSRTTTETTTETLKLNTGEVKDDEKKEKVSVEVSKQNIQEYPPELYLSPLAQLQLQNQYNPVQLGQLRAPIYLETVQQQQQLTALPAYLAQQQLIQAQLAQLQSQIQQQTQIPQVQQEFPQFVQESQVNAAPNPALLIPQDQAFAPQPANQLDVAQGYPQQPLFLQPQQNQLLPRPKDQQVSEQDQQQIQLQFGYQYQPAYQPQIQQYQPQTQQYQPQTQQYQPQTQQYQPQTQQYQPQTQQYQPQMQQYQPQTQQYQPQTQQYQPQTQQYQPQIQQYQPQTQQYQPQTQQYQPQTQQYQPQTQQYQPQIQQYQPQYPLNSYQQDLLQSQLLLNPQQQAQLSADAQLSRQQGQQPQNSLQSGLDVNQQGNGIDQSEGKDTEDDDGTTATAVATAFGARTQPRVYATYGVPVPRVRANPGFQSDADQPTTTQSPYEDGATVADATAVAKGRRPAKLRSRQNRVRPVFTLDRSGHLVLAQDQ